MTRLNSLSDKTDRKLFQDDSLISRELVRGVYGDWCAVVGINSYVAALATTESDGAELKPRSLNTSHRGQQEQDDPIAKIHNVLTPDAERLHYTHSIPLCDMPEIRHSYRGIKIAMEAVSTAAVQVVGNPSLQISL
ncbi:hypothetical protein Tco_0989408 [Tanacetum coccineum]|uniref:Uncharacterized protein n=1 Tax=Tanacetum coccineum TaxID=301880 RepID=A0ABQ5EU27_9ASTR